MQYTRTSETQTENPIQLDPTMNRVNQPKQRAGNQRALDHRLYQDFNQKSTIVHHRIRKNDSENTVENLLASPRGKTN